MPDLKYYPGEPKEFAFKQIFSALSGGAVFPVVTPVGYRWTAHPLTLRRDVANNISGTVRTYLG